MINIQKQKYHSTSGDTSPYITMCMTNINNFFSLNSPLIVQCRPPKRNLGLDGIYSFWGPYN